MVEAEIGVSDLLSTKLKEWGYEKYTKAFIGKTSRLFTDHFIYPSKRFHTNEFRKAM
jgi:hypothetical protein